MNDTSAPQRANTLLLFATFIIAVCGLIYELLAGAISSYLLGDSVFQFSLVIGLLMAAMGIGSFLSRFVTERIIETFIFVQCVIAIVGGFSAYLLFFAFSHLESYQAFLFLLCVLIGSLVGLEIPLVVRLLKEYRVLRLNVSNVLTADYIGALAASLLFPLVLVPQLGLFRSALLFGLLNCFVAALGIYVFYRNLQRARTLIVTTVLCALLLLAGFGAVNKISSFFQNRLYVGEIIFSKTTPYQKIVLTRDGPVLSLFLNGQLQFNSMDEYRYHESLVHPAMSLARRHDHILVLGGGDGLAIREILKYPDVKKITLVDLDKAMTNLFRDNPMLSKLNQQSLQHPAVQVVNSDAWKFLEQSQDFYDVVIIDLPDPSNLSISKLYTLSFYSLLARHLSADGIMVTQATSPIYAHQAFWCIYHTISATPSKQQLNDQLHALPYHAYIPTFGDWGFVLAAKHNIKWNQIKLSVTTRYLDQTTLATMPQFPPDMAESDTAINELTTHKLVPYYQEGWQKWFH
ncbi:MAG: polyamine aminopropyltransferase [Gammaproteobacteria bacterium]|nr:polyamine aminopropyltransferase [Gammaproteobacteria bacterium]